MTRRQLADARDTGKAYPEEARSQVKQLLQQGVAEDEIEKQTGVSDRTIRRWKVRHVT
jgi:uncharacterized protein YerC